MHGFDYNNKIKTLTSLNKKWLFHFWWLYSFSDLKVQYDEVTTMVEWQMTMFRAEVFPANVVKPRLIAYYLFSRYTIKCL